MNAFLPYLRGQGKAGRLDWSMLRRNPANAFRQKALPHPRPADGIIFEPQNPGEVRFTGRF